MRTRRRAPTSTSSALTASTTAPSCKSPSSPAGSTTSIAWRTRWGWDANETFALISPQAALSLSARSRAVAGAHDGDAFRQGTPCDLHAVLVEHVAQLTEQAEAVRIDPEGNHRVVGQRAVEGLAEVRAGPEGLLEGLAAVAGDRLQHPAMEQHGGEIALPLHAVVQPEGADWPGHRNGPTLPFQLIRQVAHLVLDLEEKRGQVNEGDASSPALEHQLIGCHRFADRRAKAQHLVLERHLVEFLDLPEQLVLVFLQVRQ